MALIAYLIPLLGSLFILFTSRDPFARYHARQALILPLVAVGAVLLWAVLSWILTWIPYGGVAAVLLFGLVIGVYLGLILSWMSGIINVLKAESSPILFFGAWFN